MKPAVTFNDGVYTIFTVDENGKRNQVPMEQCNDQEFAVPSEASVAYWAHYGLDRRNLKY